METVATKGSKISPADQKVIDAFEREDEPVSHNTPFKSHVPSDIDTRLYRLHRFMIDLCR